MNPTDANNTAGGTTPSAARWRVIASDIKISHSIFALPFALLATFLAAAASGARTPSWMQLLLIVLCMGFARTFAMLANRYLDREIDAGNPRTARRALPSGRLKPRDVLAAMVFCALGLAAAAGGFGAMDGNWLPLILSPLVLAWLAAYGLMKRFTLLCHFFLGAALAISPLSAAVAIYPAYLWQPTLWCLAGFVLLWVAGFDVIYALQDLQYDRRDGLHSIPAKLGRDGALVTAKILHVIALLLLVQTDRGSPLLNRPFEVGIAIVAALLIVEHTCASRNKFSMAFFTVNGVISVLLGALGIYDVLTS
jgi:4-hydroxybenzoate polyprenyltransferase